MCFCQADKYLIEHKAFAPLIVRGVYCDEVRSPKLETHERYYFWFFGYVTKLPYERKSAEANRSTAGGNGTD